MAKSLKWKRLLWTLTLLALSMGVLSGNGGAITQARNNYAANSQPSAIRASEPTPSPTPNGLVAACAEAVEELRAARKSLEADGILIERQAELLKLEREISTAAKNINALGAAEVQALKQALAAKDAVIAATEEQVKVLSKKQMTFWKKAKYFIIGGLAGAAVCAVACRK